MAKALMSDTELRRRKKLQGQISRTTSTLGLGGAAVGTAAVLASKKPGTLKHIRKIPGLKRASEQGLKDTGLYTGLASGGIGGVGGYNFAAYTNAESRKRTVKKNLESTPDLEPTYGEEGFAKNWSPVASTYDPESARRKRNEAYPKVAAGASAGLGLAAAGKLERAASLRGQSVIAREKKKPYRRLRIASGVKAKQAGKLGVASVAAGGAAVALKRKKDSQSWASYSKSDTVSPFGVDHSE